MDLRAELKELGFTLKAERELNRDLVVEWPWIEAQAVAQDKTPRRVVAMLMLEHLDANPYDVNRPYGFLVVGPLRERMVAHGWRDPRATVLYRDMPEAWPAWLTLCGDESEQIVKAIKVAMIEAGSEKRPWKFHDVCRRAVAQYLFDNPDAERIEDEANCRNIYHAIGREFVKQFYLE